jgi:hypothetical protein
VAAVTAGLGTFADDPARNLAAAPAALTLGLLLADTDGDAGLGAVGVPILLAGAPVACLGAVPVPVAGDLLINLVANVPAPGVDVAPAVLTLGLVLADADGDAGLGAVGGAILLAGAPIASLAAVPVPVPGDLLINLVANSPAPGVVLAPPLIAACN